MTQNDINLGSQLVQALTERQLVRFLDFVVSPSDLSTLHDKLLVLEPDLAETIAKIHRAAISRRGKAQIVKEIASTERTLETWDNLWRDWGHIVGEVGDEEGEYANQDNHWEPAYFDCYALSDDLEPIGEKMLALIPQVHAQVDDAELFFEACAEIEAGIELYPEWMGAADGDPVELGPKVTRCALEWSWLEAQYDDDPGIAFVREVAELENMTELVELSSAACEAFLIRLPDDVCRNILTYLSGESGDIDTSNPHSFWHRVKHDYEKRFDSEQYLETCRAHLSENWQYGIPLIEAAIESQAYEDADRLAAETLAILLKRDRDNPWVPEESLLPVEMFRFYHGHSQLISHLLSIWAEVAEALGNRLRQAALEFQCLVLCNPEQLEAIIHAYGQTENRAAQQMLAPLFDQWENIVAARSLGLRPSSKGTPETWVHWMIDASLGGRSDAKTFIAQCRTWLGLLRDKPAVFKSGWRWLAVLTGDLPQSRDLPKQHPTFYHQILSGGPAQNQLDNARRALLQKMNPGPLFEAAMDVWRQRLRDIVPDPADAGKSQYDIQARWAQCLFEVSPEQYQVLLRLWRQQHGLKRNLWRDMKKFGLPV